MNKKNATGRLLCIFFLLLSFNVKAQIGTIYYDFSWVTSPDKTILAVIDLAGINGYTDTVSIYDIGTLEKKKKFFLPKGNDIRLICINPSNTYLAAYYFNNNNKTLGIKIWGINTGRLTRTIEFDTDDRVHQICFKDDKCITVLYQNKSQKTSIRTYSVETGELISKVNLPDSEPSDTKDYLKYSPNGQYLAVLCGNDKILIDTEKENIINKSFLYRNGYPFDFVFTQDNKSLLSLEEFGTAKIYRTSPLNSSTIKIELKKKISIAEEYLYDNRFAFSTDGKYCVCITDALGGKSALMSVYNTSGTFLSEIRVNCDQPQYVTFDNTNENILLFDTYGTVNKVRFKDNILTFEKQLKVQPYSRNNDNLTEKNKNNNSTQNKTIPSTSNNPATSNNVSKQELITIKTDNGVCSIPTLYSGNFGGLCKIYTYKWDGPVDRNGKCSGYGKLEVYSDLENDANCIKLFGGTTKKALAFQYIGKMVNGKFEGRGQCGWNFMSNRNCFQVLRKGEFANGLQTFGEIIIAGSTNPSIKYDEPKQRFFNEYTAIITGSYQDGDISEGMIRFDNGDYIVGKFITYTLSVQDCYYYSSSKDTYTKGSYMDLGGGGAFYPGVSDIYNAGKKLNEMFEIKNQTNIKTKNDALGAIVLAVGIGLTTYAIISEFFSSEEPPSSGINYKNTDLYILSIGVSDYNENAHSCLSDLNYANADAVAITDRLKKGEGNQQLFNNVYSRVLTNAQATKANVEEALNWISNSANKDDIILITISSHGGASNPTNLTNYYITPYDFNCDNYASGVNLDMIIKGINCENCATLIWIDACYAGGANNDFIKNFDDYVRSKQGQKVNLFLSSNETYSLESSSWGHGAFSKTIIDGLNGAADQNNNHIISLRELTEYVILKVPQLTGNKQYPFNPVKLFPNTRLSTY